MEGVHNFLEPDVSSCFVNTVTWNLRLPFHGQFDGPRKVNQLVEGSCILRMHYMWSLQNKFSQRFLFLLWSMLSLSQTCVQCICFIFPFLFIYHSFHIWPNPRAKLIFDILQWIPSNKESLFALNHLIYIFSIYIYIYMIYIITFFRRLRSVRLIRREQGSLSVGKNFGLAKTLAANRPVFCGTVPNLTLCPDCPIQPPFVPDSRNAQ